jgi:hypothetical protein
VAADATITAPTNNQVAPLAGVTFTGNATDNIGVAGVRVAIQNRTTKRWLSATGTWVTSTTWLPGAALSSPGMPSAPLVICSELEAALGLGLPP